MDMNHSLRIIFALLSIQALLFSPCQAAEKSATEKSATGKSVAAKPAAQKPAAEKPAEDWAKYVVAAPEVRYPSLVERTGTAGVGTYVLVINPKNGEVTEVKVVKSAGFRKIDAIHVMNFFEWRFRPGTITSAQITRGVTVYGRSRGYHSGRY